MKTTTLLLLLHLNVFALGSNESTTNASKATQAVQSIQQEPTFVEVSDVPIGIYKALKEAGITMPVPKRELKREI